MDITMPVTDYIKGSLLTTQGDLVKHDGADAARLPLGPAYHIVQVNPAGDDLEYVQSGLWLFNVEFSAQNGGSVTLLSTAVTITTIDLGNVFTNGRFGVYAMVFGVKGLSTGTSYVRVMKESGTADIFFYNSNSGTVVSQYHPSSGDAHFILACVIKVTSSGTLVLKLDGWSLGSNTTVNPGNGQLYAHRLKVA